jgi:hypothetical protein
MAAMSLGRTETALGAFCRRLVYRVGKAKASTACASFAPCVSAPPISASHSLIAKPAS